MFSKILVGINGSGESEKAFEHACFLSQKSGAQLLILHVLEEFPNIGYSISKSLEGYSKDILRKYEDKAKKLGLQSVNTIQAKGQSVVQQILEAADKQDVDTIVVGSRGHYISSEQFLLGSTSYKLSHYAKCTLIIVR